ncbi:MAG: HlyC/CorC family transporter [Ruminococcus sp.]|nr:HlyC/CorC family transporter [Ruminococcus sp.]
MARQIILQIILILFTALFTFIETAVISVSDTKLEKLAAGGNKKAKRLKKLTDSPDRFFSAVRTAAVITGLLSSAFAVTSFRAPAVNAVIASGTSINRTLLNAAVTVVITIAAAYFMIVFGYLIPKHAAARRPEKAALALSGAIKAVSAVFAPFVWLTNVSANGLLRLCGIDPSSSAEAVTEEEILMMSDAGAENGTIDEDENRIIKNVFAFDDLTAEQVCTHRTDVSVLWSNDDIGVWEETIHRTRHSVFPICGESVDNVIGILDAKDYFRLDDKSRDNIMDNAVREPLFVHENMKADRLFEQMKQDGSDHFAVVVDEYGGMSGIVTITDLVEQLVGDFADDHEDEPAVKLAKTAEDEWIVPGISALTEICDELDISLPADKYDTFGGYVIDKLGHIPKNGTQLSLEADGLHIDIVEVKHHRIEACRVKVLERYNDDEEE